MLAYAGKGYTQAFSENYDRVIARLAAGEDIAIVEGPDDICAALLAEPDCHCHNESVRRRDRDAAQAVADRLGRPIGVGETLALDARTLATLRAGFADGNMRKACGAYPDSQPCEWHDTCSAIAAAGFADTRLRD